MPQRSEYAPGTPSWVDLGTSDIEGAKAFYTELFGWEAIVASEPEARGYVMFTKDGHGVAGMGSLMMEDQPVAWNSYISVADADATTAAAKEAGARMILQPMDVLDVGRMAIFFDTVGAAISVWQPRQHIGSGLVNEPGSLCWNELTTRDAEGAKAFYGAVFGWHANELKFPGPDGAEMSYTEWRLTPDTDPDWRDDGHGRFLAGGYAAALDGLLLGR